MNYIISIVFVCISIWQFTMTWRTFTHLKKEGNQNTSPFIMLSLFSSLLFAVLFLAIALFSFSNTF